MRTMKNRLMTLSAAAALAAGLSAAAYAQTVQVSTEDVSPAGSFIQGEEAAVLKLGFTTDAGTAELSRITVHNNPSGSNGIVSTISVYADDGDGVWDGADELLASSEAGNTEYVDVVFSPVSLTTTKTTLFITVTPTVLSGSKINFTLDSTDNFDIADGTMLPVSPIVSTPREVLGGVTKLASVPDGQGGAFIVYDSTVAPGGSRSVFIKRVNGNNAVLFGPTAVHTGYGDMEESVLPAGASGAIVGWKDPGTGIFYAQEYNSGGAVQWAPSSGVQVSSGSAQGGMFVEASGGGAFALFGYTGAGGMKITAQRLDNSGQCLWPSPGNCVSGSTGWDLFTPVNPGRMTIYAAPDDVPGSMVVSWSDAGGGGDLELYGTKISALGSLVYNKQVFSAVPGSDEGEMIRLLSDGSGGVYAVWASSQAGARNLYANRFDPSGAALWGSALQLTDSSGAGSGGTFQVARDTDGFAVWYDTNTDGNSPSDALRVVRVSSTGVFASGWAVDGKYFGEGEISDRDFVRQVAYSGSAYNFVWADWDVNDLATKLYYQKMSLAGAYSYPSGDLLKTYPAVQGISSALAPDGTGGAVIAAKAGAGDDYLVRMSSAIGVPATGFTGDFSSTAGYNGGDLDMGRGVVFYNSSVYAIGISSPAGGLLIKYDQAGNVVSSASFAGSAFGLGVNGNGVYVAGQWPSVGFVTAKYDHDLLVSSVAVLPGDASARDLALDQAGNVYVIGSNKGEGGSNNDYKIVKYDANLAQLGAPALFNAGGYDQGRGIAVDYGSVYATGDSLVAGTTYFVTVRLNSASLAFVSSVTYGGAADVDPAYPVGEKLAADPNTHDVYLAASSRDGGVQNILTVRYSQNLVQLGTARLSSPDSAQGSAIKLDSAGNVYTLGGYSLGSNDDPVLLKYNSDLVFISSAASQQAGGYFPVGLSLDPVTGNWYVTGVALAGGSDPAKWDMRTMRFDPLGSGTYTGAVFSGSFLNSVTGAYYGLAAGLEVDNIAVDNASSGGPFVYVVGNASNSVTGKTDGFVIKYNSSGDKLAYKLISQPSRNFTAEAVKVGSGGKVYVAGEAAGFPADYSLLVKFNSDLTVVSSATHPGVDLTMALGPSDSVVLGGFISNAPSYPRWNVTKYDSSLDLLGSSFGLAEFASGSATETVQGLYVNSNYIFAAGNVWDPVSGSYNWVVRKLKSDLSEVKDEASYAAGIADGALGAANLGHLSVVGDSKGGLYVAGPAASDGHVVTGATRRHTRNGRANGGGGGLDFLVRKYDINNLATGFVNEATYASQGGWDDEPLAADLDRNGNLVVTGWSFDETRTYQDGALLVYSPALALISSAPVMGIGLAAESARDYAYLTNGGGTQAHTYQFPLPSFSVISGSVTYSGFRTGTPIVALFSSPDLLNSSPAYFVNIDTLTSPWSYASDPVRSGTYYLASVLLSLGTGAGPQKYDPWAVLGSTSSPTPVVFPAGGTLTGRDFTLVDGSYLHPDPFYAGVSLGGNISYSGDQPAPDNFMVAVSSVGPHMSAGQPVLVSTRSIGGAYSFSGLDGGATYYVMAWIDTDTVNPTLDCGEPQGAYQPLSGTDCALDSRAVFLAADKSDADITVVDFGRISGTVTNTTSQNGTGVFSAAHTSGACVPFTMRAASSGQYDFWVANCGDPYKLKLYVDANGNGAQEYREASGSAAADLYINSSTRSVDSVDILLSTPPNRSPQLDWAGGMRYEDSGVNYTSGNTSLVFTFRVKYTDPDNDSPLAGPVVYITTGTSYVPHQMTALDPGDADYSDGRIYTYSTTLSTGAGYAYQYYFEAYDSSGSAAAVSMSTPIAGPDVSAAPVLTFSSDQDVQGGTTAQLLLADGVYDGDIRLARDAAGNLYTLQYAYLEDAGDYEAMLTRRDPSGAVQWTRFLPSDYITFKDIGADAAGNTYLLGTYDTAFVAKYSPVGEEVWVSTFDSSELNGISVSPTGTSYVAATDNYKIRIFKIDASGVPLWQAPVEYQTPEDTKTGASFSDEAGAIYIVPKAGAVSVYVAGTSERYPDYTYDGLILKFTDNGNTITGPDWAARYAGGNDSDKVAPAYAIVADQVGNVYAAGNENRDDLNQGFNIWLAKYDASGVKQWSKTYNSDQYSNDSASALALDPSGNVYLAGFLGTYEQGYNFWLAKYSPGGALLVNRSYDSTDEYGYSGYDQAYDLVVGSASVYAAGVFGYNSGLYLMPTIAGGAQAASLTVLEGPRTGSVALSWDYASALPPGSSFYIQASPDASPVWDPAQAQVVVSTRAAAFDTQAYTYGGLATMRDPGQGITPEYKFKVWLSSAPGVYTALPAAASYAKTPFAYDNTQYFGKDRLSYLSNVSVSSANGSAIALDGDALYQAFGNDSGDSVGLALRKYNLNSYVEWTRFFNTAAGAYYSVNQLLRDASGNFYAVGSQASVDAPENKDFWIGKFSADGYPVWNYTQDVNGGRDELRDAALDGSGGLYVAGEFYHGGTGADIIVRKYDISPSTYTYAVWTSTQAGYGSGDDRASGIAVDAANARVYAVGTITSMSGGGDIWVEKLRTATGALVSSATYTSAGYHSDAGRAIAVNASGVYIAGSMSDTSDVKNLYAARLPLALGPAVWSTEGGSQYGSELTSVKLDGEGNVYGAGYEISQEQGMNAIYGKLSSDGAAEWNRYFDNYGDEAASSLQVDASGRVCSSMLTGSGGAYSPGFYVFPQPVFALTAAAYSVPGSMELKWMARASLDDGATFYVQYSTYSGAAWSTAAAQVSYYAGPDLHILEGQELTKDIFGLDNGTDPQGLPVGPDYYFRVWFSTASGTFTAVQGMPSAKAANGAPSEKAATYSGNNKLFTMGTLSDPGPDELNGVAKDPLGNIYTVTNADLDWNSVFILKKFNPAGDAVWTKTYSPGEGYSVKANRVAADPSGNIYLTGTENSNSGGGAGSDAFLMKYDPAGLLAWKYASSLSGDDAGYGVAADTSGYVYVSGSSGPAPTEHARIEKFSVSGSSGPSLRWTASYPVDGSIAYGLAVRGNSVYAAGTSRETAGLSVWLGRYNAATGAKISTAAITNSSPDASKNQAAYAVAADPASGAVYAAGETYSPEYGANVGVVYKSSADLSDFGVTVATYSSGSSWASNAAAYGLTLDAAGGVYATGMEERYDIGQDKNLWIRKYDPGLSADSELWTQTFDSRNGSEDMGLGVAVDAAGYVYAGGRFGYSGGMYRYKQINALAYKPTLTARVLMGYPNSAAVSNFPGVDVAFIPYSQTGGIDASGIKIASTSASGYARVQVPAGKQYFIALSTQGYAPTIKSQQTDPYGTFFVQLAGDTTKQLTLYAASDPGSPLTVTVTSAAAGDILMAEVFYTQTGEKVAYGIGKIGVGRSSATFTVPNVPAVAANIYTLGLTIPARSMQRSIAMDYAFPGHSAYSVSMSTEDGAVVSAAGFDVAASTTPAAYEGVVRDTNYSPLEGARVTLYHQGCALSRTNPAYDEHETMTDVNGKFSFYDVPASTVPYRVSVMKSGYSSDGRGGCGLENGPVVSGDGAADYTEFDLAQATYTFKGVITYNGMPVPDASVMVSGDSNWYAAASSSDVYRAGGGMGATDKTRTGPDGSFAFSPATANGLLEGGLRLSVDFLGNWKDVTAANNIRIVISGQRSVNPVSPTCAIGKVWVLKASDGACLTAASPGTPLTFDIKSSNGETNGLLYGSVVFVTTYTISAQAPLVISTAAPVGIMAVGNCSSDCSNRSIGLTSLSGIYTVNTATYSIALSTGVTYTPKIVSSDWGLAMSFDSGVTFSTAIPAVKMDFTVGKSGGIKGNILLPNGSSYKPNWSVSQDAPAYHSVYISAKGTNADVSDEANIDQNGEFEFPNIAPGTYNIAVHPQGAGFVWPNATLEGVPVTAGKATEVKLQLSDGLVVQPQIVGLPEISTSAWKYLIIPVESGTEMNQKKITELFFGKDTFAFEYSTAASTWDKRYMLPGRYDFYLMLASKYDPCSVLGHSDCVENYTQFGNFIGKVKGVAVQRSENNPGLGSYSQPIPVNVLGAVGQGSFQGLLTGNKVFTAQDCKRIAANFDEIMPLIPAVMIYDAAGDLKGYTAALPPTAAGFAGFYSGLMGSDPAVCKDYFSSHSAGFLVAGLPPGKYTAVFNNPNYPPVAKELELPYENYRFNYEEQNVPAGSISGMVKSSATLEPLANATVYLKHRTVEKYATTGADGTFSFENLPAGIYRLEVMHNGFVKAGEKTSLSGSDAVSLGFSMTPSASSISGKVYMSKFPSPVTKAGVKLVAYDETMNVQYPSAYLPTIEANTGSGGEYELTGILSGHLYKVSAFYPGKLTTTVDIDAVDGVTYMDDIVLLDIRPQITVKVQKSPDSASKVDVTIKSPKTLVTAPVCRFSPGSTYVSSSAVTLALVPGTNNTYSGQFTVSRNQRYYTVYIQAGDTDKAEKTVLYDQNNEARTEQYIQDEAIQGGEVQMDAESEEYSGIELDPGALSYSTASAVTSSAYSAQSNGGDLVGGFFSGLPSVRTVKTAKGNLTIEAAVQNLMASEVYNMDISNASANKPFTLTLKYDKEKGADNQSLKIYQYDAATGEWKEVPGNYTVDPMLGVVSVDVGSLANASDGTGGANTPLMRKRFNMSAVVNGRYVPAAAGAAQSGQFAVFTAKPDPRLAYAGEFEVYNMPNPFNLKNKTITNIEGRLAFGGASTYVAKGTLIKYHLPPGKSGDLKFVIYDLAGEKVRTIDDGPRDGGFVYYSEWDGKNDNGADCASGVYFMLTFVDGKRLGIKAHKMALIK